MTERRHTQAWVLRQMYRYWFGQEGEYLTEEEPTEEEQERLEKARKWHPSQGIHSTHES